jgi:hypothetical protein
MDVTTSRGSRMRLNRLVTRVKRMPIVSMARRTEASPHPADTTVALAAAVSLLIFAWGLGEIVRSL